MLFIFATTEPHKIPDTVLSRCQRFDFRRISEGQIVGALKRIAGEESIEVQESVLLDIIEKHVVACVIRFPYWIRSSRFVGKPC